MNKLNKFKKKRVTLEELLSAGIGEQEILAFVNEGKLVPINSSGTNGNLRSPLYKKYSISLNYPAKTCLLLSARLGFSQTHRAFSINNHLQQVSDAAFLSRK